MTRRFIIVLPKEDGGVEVHPMKDWLRQHPDNIPTGLDPTSSTSHQLRDGLKRSGWSVEERADEVRMIVPGEYQANIDDLLGGEEEQGEQGEEATETSFGLEHQLRDFIAQNLPAISFGECRLQVYVDPAGKDGVEYPTPVGRIDILAVDEAAQFVVFELKRGRGPDHAIGQLARYMGWVKQTIGKDRDVRGVIVAKTITDKLRYASSIIPGVSLFEYEVEFHLQAADE